MLALGTLAFASPWLLVALAALPVIWWLLRVTPPAPRLIAFPAIRLLLGLTPREETPARTPWWLILLRTVIAALVIIALAHPLLNPQTRLAGAGPVALVIDDGWAAARDWRRRQVAAIDILAEAKREDRQIVLVTTAPAASDEPAPALAPIRAADARAAVEALAPKPWPGDRQAALARLQAMPLPQDSMAVWLSDGVDDGAAKALADYLAGRGNLRYIAAPPADAPRLLGADAAAGELAGKDLGGVLLRFAGVRLAEQGDHLLPVRLRRGGRTIGGALSWETPAKLAPFAAESPFAGLAVPADVTVTRQVLAEPDLDLAGKSWARLADGTPLVTAEKLGQGWTVLVHTTANAEWSDLALSGLFVQMLRRVVAMSQGVAAASDGPLAPVETLDGFGHLQHAPPTARAIPGKEIATAKPSPRHPPGFYGTTDARVALNLSTAISELNPIGELPAGVARENFAKSAEVDIRPS